MDMEKFKCLKCGFEISVEFSAEEISRDVPCGGCYFETFAYDESINETVKTAHGEIILCEKGKGI